MACPVINWWAVIVATVAFWVLGALWYSPVLFGKRWQKELGFTDEYLKSGSMVITFGLSFVLMLVMVFGMSLMLNFHKPEDICWLNGMYLGFFAGLFFAITAIGINYLYQRRSIVLWLIDGFYMIIGLGIAGIILGAWK
ncbi:MAG: DUF1761 domain-containing protein [Bacteroidales bacterium]|nr:DUF1761 domain-containing protein [Bacteroidales bacterium]